MEQGTAPQVTGIYRNRSNITLTSAFPPSSPADSIESSDSLKSSSVDMESDPPTQSSVENDITIHVDPSLRLPLSPLMLALKEVEALYKPRARIIAPADHTTKEKMRRERIKDSCAQLRILLPYIRGRKTDMASILETCVDYLRIVNGLLPREVIQKVTEILGRETADVQEQTGNHKQCLHTVSPAPPSPCASYLSSSMDSSPGGYLVTPPATPESPFFDWGSRQCDTPGAERDHAIESIEHTLRPPEPIDGRTPYAKRLRSEQALHNDRTKMRRLSAPDRLTPGVYTNPIGQTPAACQFLVFDDVKPSDYMGLNTSSNTTFHDEYLQLPMIPDVRFLNRLGATGSITGTTAAGGPLYSSAVLGRTATSTSRMAGTTMEDSRHVMFVCPDNSAGTDVLPLAHSYTPVHMYNASYPKNEPAMIPIGNPDLAYLPSLQQPLPLVKHDYDSHSDWADPLQACFTATYGASSDYPPDPERHYVNPNAVLPLCQPPNMYRVSLQTTASQSTSHTSITTSTSTQALSTATKNTAAITSQMVSSAKSLTHASNKGNG